MMVIPSSVSFPAFESEPSQDMASVWFVIVLEAKVLGQAPESTRLCSFPGAHVSVRHGPPVTAPRALLVVLALGVGGGLAVAAVMVISVSLCLVAACPPSLLVPVVQDLEVSGVLFSSSFPSVLPSHTLRTRLLAWL